MSRTVTLAASGLAAGSLAAGLLVSALAFAQDEQTQTEAAPDSLHVEAPFVKVSDELPLPEFIPGLGILYVDPGTLPAGPFLAYDHDGKLSATVYMTPLGALEEGTSYDNLPVGEKNVEFVDVYFNAGHPGVEEPHAHIVLYHDTGAKERLEK